MSGVMDRALTLKYEVSKRLGRGAYGIVWKAKSRRYVSSFLGGFGIEWLKGFRGYLYEL